MVSLEFLEFAVLTIVLNSHMMYQKNRKRSYAILSQLGKRS